MRIKRRFEIDASVKADHDDLNALIDDLTKVLRDHADKDDSFYIQID